MLDSARILTNVCSVNRLQVVPILDLQASSNPVAFSIQLWQSDLGMRYIPQAGVATTVTIEFLRSNTVGMTPTSQTVSKPAALAFPADDRSIWSCTLSSADVSKIVTGGYRVTVVETINAVVTTQVVFMGNTIRKVPSSGA